MRTSVENKVVFGFILAVLALTGIGFFSYFNTADLVATEHWVAHTQKVISTLEAGMANLTDAETSQRGFLLTGDNQFLKDSIAAQAQIDGWLKTLRDLLRDNPIQLKNLDALEPLIRKRVEILNSRIRERQEKGLQAAALGVASRDGKRVMDAIWQKISQMRGVEDELLQIREQAAQRSAENAESIILGGSVLTALLGLVAITIVRRDLRLRELAENETQSTRTQLQSILDNTPAIVFLKDLEGRYQFVNRRFEQVAGRSRDQIVGKTIFEVATPEIARASREHQKKILAAQAPLEFEEVVVYTDGPRPHLAVKFPLRDAAGKIYAIAGISSDISERKKIEELHLHFRALFESLPGLYVVLKPDFTMVAVSDAFLKATMTTREQILGRNFFAVFPDSPANENATGAVHLRASLDRVLQNSQTDTMAIQRYDMRRPDGVFEERFWSPVNSSVSGMDGKIEYIIHRVEDVTEFVRKKRTAVDDENLRDRMERMEAEIFRSSQEIQLVNQQLRFANQELEAFSYSVSHDLRAPLRHIHGFVDLLKKQALEKLNEKENRFLKIIADSAREMGTLIDNLLFFSRMSRTELRRVTVASNQLVEEAINTFRPEIAGREIVWNIAALPDSEADAAMLRQVWTNLIGNAIKYSRTRTPAQIEIGFSETAKEQIFFVRDNGVGFDMQYVEKLFGVFQRLHRTDEFEGTGIGLANVRRIISRHGGRTWAEGKVDGGATFFFSLPKLKN